MSVGSCEREGGGVPSVSAQSLQRWRVIGPLWRGRNLVPLWRQKFQRPVFDLVQHFGKLREEMDVNKSSFTISQVLNSTLKNDIHSYS